MNRIAGRAGVILLLILLLIAGLSFFVVEYAIEADDWVIFAGSPHVYNGGNIGCGTVVDCEGTFLLDMTDGRIYSDSEEVRRSTVHWLGDRYGSISAPALSTYSAQMAGYDVLNGVYNYGDNNGLAELTLSAKVQAVALEAMGEYKGTVAVYNYKTGALLCAVTTPAYDPDNVPDIALDTTGAYEGLYVNRFTQSSYIPGSIFKIVTLAAALETIPDIEEQTFSCTGKIAFGVDEIVCEDSHWDQTLQEAFRNSCNCAFAEIALQLGDETLQEYVELFGITDSLTFDGITTAAGNFEAAGEADVNVAWSAIGQYNDQINPCAFMNFMGAVANGGRGVTPYLVDRISVNKNTTYSADVQKADRIMSADTAQVLAEYLRLNVTEKYGAENFPGLTVCAKTGTGEVGGEKKPNAMLTGFVTDEEYPLAFVVCVEDAGYGKTVCIPIASKVLGACKEIMDKTA